MAEARAAASRSGSHARFRARPSYTRTGYHPSPCEPTEDEGEDEWSAKRDRPNNEDAASPLLKQKSGKSVRQSVALRLFRCGWTKRTIRVSRQRSMSRGRKRELVPCKPLTRAIAASAAASRMQRSMPSRCAWRRSAALNLSDPSPYVLHPRRLP